MNSHNLKVLWFSNTPANGAKVLNLKVPGGGWIQSLDKELQKIVELHIAFHYPKSSKPYKHGNSFYYPITPRNWKLEMLKNILANKVYDKDYKNYYLNLINQIKPDIIHIHGTENPFACIIGEVHIPVVVSVQGVANVIAHKYLNGFPFKYLKVRRISIRDGFMSMLLSRSFKSEYKRIKRIASIESRNLQCVDFVIGRTQWDKRTLSLLAPRAKYFLCNEILREGFYENAWMMHENPGIIIHSTNGNSYFKGFETICRSLTELNKLGIKTEWRIAGVKETDLIVKLAKKDLGKDFPKTGLKFLGHLGEKDLINRMLEADVFIMASHIENSSNSLCEAMILGMPCIATFAGGTGSLIEDGKNGILVQDGDPWAMAGAIIELTKNTQVRISLGREARLTAMKRHNRAQIISDIMDIYTTIIKEYV